MTKYTLNHLSKPLVFIHQARCGGNKLNYILMHFFNEQEWFKLGENFDGSENLQYPQLLEDIAIRQRHAYLGHNCYGLHHVLQQPVSYITNIREPIARVVSIYTRWKDETPSSLIDTLSADFESHNGMTKRLAGIGELDGRFYDFNNQCFLSNDKVDEQIYDRAIQHLDEHIEAIIMLEKINECTVLLEEKYALPPLAALSINHLNQTSNVHNLPKPFIREQWLQWIIDNNEFDIRLYDYAKNKVTKALNNLPPLTREKIRLRHIFTSALTEKGTSVLTFAGILKNFGDLFTKLHRFAMQDEFYLIAEQLLTHPEMPTDASFLVLNQIASALSDAQKLRLVDKINTKLSF